MEKKFNADLAAIIKEPLTQALTAVRLLANMGYTHVQLSHFKSSIHIDIFENTIRESKETQAFLEPFLENGWEWKISDRSKDVELPYTCLKYSIHLDV